MTTQYLKNMANNQLTDSCDSGDDSESSSDEKYVCRGTPNDGPHSYVDPRVLSCLHSFCKTCLENRVANNTITCPTCTESTALDITSGVDGLPADVRLVHEMSAATTIANANSSTPVVCKVCVTGQVAKSYCIDCGEFLCNDCKRFHTLQTATVNHTVIDIKDLSVSCLLAKSKLLFCHCHNKQPLDMYCLLCRTVDCPICINVNHPYHNCLNVNIIFEQSKKEIEHSLSPLNDAITEMETCLAKNISIRAQLKEKTRNTTATIEETFKALHTALDKRKEKLLQDLQCVSSAKECRLQRKMEELEKESDKMKSSVNTIKSKLDTYTPEELLPISDTFKTYLNKKIKDYDSSITHPPSVDSSKIVISMAKDAMMTKISEFGEVETSVCPPSSNIIGKQVARCVAGKKCSITLEAKNTKGERYSKGGDVVNVTLMGNNNPIQGEVIDKGNGQYELLYTPPIAGRYQLHVTINNQHIKSSPFAVIVRPYRDYCQLGKPTSIYNIDDYPRSLCTSPDGTLYVSCNTSICKYNGNGVLIATIGRDDDTMKFTGCNWGIVVKGDVIYVANESNEKDVIQLTTSGSFIERFGTAKTLSHIAVSEDNKVYVTIDTYIHVYMSTGALIKRIDCGKRVYGLSLDPCGDIHVVAMSHGLVLVYSPDGKYIRQYGEKVLNDPFGILVDEEGYSLVSEHTDNGQLKIFNQLGQLIHSVGKFQYSTGVCIDNQSNIFVINQVDNQVFKF